MGQIHKVQAVKFIVGVLAINEEALAEAGKLIARKLGAVESVSEVWPFSSTKYYAKEMSEKLLRQFVSLAELGDPTEVVKLKLSCSSAELTDAGERGRGERRAINLDPGYITPAKLVLASTKDYSHRVYLGEGIYGEVTLGYEQGAWRTFAWSYPDYAEGRYHEFFSQVRGRLLQQLREQEDN